MKASTPPAERIQELRSALTRAKSTSALRRNPVLHVGSADAEAVIKEAQQHLARSRQPLQAPEPRQASIAEADPARAVAKQTNARDRQVLSLIHI